MLFRLCVEIVIFQCVYCLFWIIYTYFLLIVKLINLTEVKLGLTDFFIFTPAFSVTLSQHDATVL